MQEITLDKYVEINEKYASYDNDGYYIEPIIILVMIFDNLQFGLSFEELKEFVKTVDVIISEESLCKFIEQKRKETNKKSLSNQSSEALSTREYLRDYLEKRKKKCTTLFDIYEDVEAVKEDRKLTTESLERLNMLGIHFNDYGCIYYEDALRLAKAIVFNVKDLYKVGGFANKLESYWDSKANGAFVVGSNGLSKVTDRLLDMEEQSLEFASEGKFQTLKEKKIVGPKVKEKTTKR